jgi:hypothetical protein
MQYVNCLPIQCRLKMRRNFKCKIPARRTATWGEWGLHHWQEEGTIPTNSSFYMTI